MSLVRCGLVIDYNTLSPIIHKVRKIFSITTLGHNNTRKTICMIYISKHPTKKVIIPRFGGFMLQKIKLVNDITNNLQPGESVDYKRMTITPTHNQHTVINHLIKNIYTKENIKCGKSSTILQMSAGYGKTYLAIVLLYLMKKKTFIIVPNEYLLKQWVNILETTFPDNSIGVFYGKKKKDGDVIVSIINSALKYDEYDNIGLVIYDEVHMYCSNKFVKIFSLAQAKLCLGITATPNQRLDKFDPVSRWALGEIVYADKLDGWDPAAVDFKTEVTRIIFNGHEDYTKIIESKAGIVSVPLMINQLQDDPYRNKVIIMYAIKLYNIGRNVFVFSDRRDHLHTLSNILTEMEIDCEAPELDNKQSAIKKLNNTHEKVKINGVTKLMGGSTDNDIENAKSTGRIVLTTFQYSGTGVSINKMNSLILATPRKSNMTQILGRIYRLSSDDTIKRHIIDIVDNRICLKSQYYHRKKTYKEMYATINDVKINWDDM